MTKLGSGEEILLTAIREAFRTLTVGQLIELAATPLGRGLVDYRLTDLLPKTAAPRTGAQSKEPAAQAQPTTAKATTKPRKRATKSTTVTKPPAEKESATKGRAPSASSTAGKESPRKKSSAAKASPRARRGRKTAAAFSTTKLDARVLEMLKVTGAQLNILELQAATGESKMRVYRSLQRLVLAGKVRSDASKRPHTYALVAPPAG